LISKTLAAGGIIRSAGPGTWTGTGNINAAQGSMIVNSGVFTVQNDAHVIFLGGSPQPVWMNTGSFTKTADTNTTFDPVYGGMAFNNSGTISVQSGVLSLGGGGTGTNGTFSTSSGCRLDLASGAGVTRIAGGAVSLGGGVSTFSGNGAVEVASGNLAGSSTFTGTGAFNWTGGSISATLTLPSTISFNLSGSSDKALAAGGVIRSAGPGTWTGGGNINASQGSMIINSGVFTVQNDAHVIFLGGSPQPVWVNSGTFCKTNSTGTTTFDAI
jgi:lipopolysaccharide export system protein LptA